MKKNRFHFLTFSGFFIETSRDYRILVDPFLDGNPHVKMNSSAFERVDLILATHGAYDHVGDTATIAKRCGSWVVCPDDVKALLLHQGVAESQIIAVPWGMTVDFRNGVRVKPLENHHRTHVTLPDGRDFASQPLAFLLYLEDGTRVYIAGDTALFHDMKLQGELYRPHIGLINAVTDQLELPDDPERPRIVTGEMSPYEAALCAKWLMLDVAVPCHHITLANPQIQEFADIVERMNGQEGKKIQVVLLEAGETFSYSAVKEDAL